MLSQTLQEILKEEAQWKPSLNSKTLEILREWNRKGNKWLSTQNLDPLSKIEFKVIHLAECKLMYNDSAFRDETLTWNELESPEWPLSLKFLEESQFKLMKSLQIIDDAYQLGRVHSN